MKLVDRIKAVPWWGWAAGVASILVQRQLYNGGAALSRSLGTLSYAFEWKIPFIDDLFPVVPVFAVIYLYSFIFWICAPAAVSLTSRRNFVNYAFAQGLGYLVGFVFFVFVPTYMDRVKEGLMELSGRPGVFNQLLDFIYGADGGEKAYNLAPSYHCLVSAASYLGVMRRQDSSKGYRVYALVMTVLICLSTLYTKQHYAVDVISGVGIAVVCHVLMQKLDPGKRLVRDGK